MTDGLYKVPSDPPSALQSASLRFDLLHRPTSCNQTRRVRLCRKYRGMWGWFADFANHNLQALSLTSCASYVIRSSVWFILTYDWLLTALLTMLDLLAPMFSTPCN